MNLTVVVETKRVVSHKQDGMPLIETIKQTISPKATFDKFLKYLPNQGYSKVTVLSVLEDEKEVDKVSDYQFMVNNNLNPANPIGSDIDYKALSEKQSNLLKAMEDRLAALENKSSGLDRESLEKEANEKGVEFRSNISDESLLKKIKESNK